MTAGFRGLKFVALEDVNSCLFLDTYICLAGWALGSNPAIVLKA